MKYNIDFEIDDIYLKDIEKAGGIQKYINELLTIKSALQNGPVTKSTNPSLKSIAQSFYNYNDDDDVPCSEDVYNFEMVNLDQIRHYVSQMKNILNSIATTLPQSIFDSFVCDDTLCISDGDAITKLWYYSQILSLIVGCDSEPDLNPTIFLTKGKQENNYNNKTISTYHTSPETKQTIDSVLSLLSSDEEELFRLAYGLVDGVGKTYLELAKIYGTSSFYIQYKLAKINRKLKHPSRKNILNYFD